MPSAAWRLKFALWLVSYVPRPVKRWLVGYVWERA